MGFVSGIKGISKSLEPAEATGVKWAKLTDGQTVKLRFLNELDDSSPMYDESRGLAVLVEQHTSPFDFKKSAQCTLEDEGRCWACEQVPNNREWRRKQRFYTNVIIDNGIDDPFVAVWHMSPWKNTTWEMILDHFGDNGSLSDYTFKLKRKGSGINDTTYIFTPGAQDKTPFDWSGFESFDLEKAIRHIPYADQAAFFAVAPSQRTADADGKSEDNSYWE